jgi:hypothetical protein
MGVWDNVNGFIECFGGHGLSFRRGYGCLPPLQVRPVLCDQCAVVILRQRTLSISYWPI